MTRLCLLQQLRRGAYIITHAKKRQFDVNSNTAYTFSFVIEFEHIVRPCAPAHLIVAVGAVCRISATRTQTMGFKDETQYPFLADLEQHHMSLRGDFHDLLRFTSSDRFVVTSTATRAVRSARTDWKAFAFLVHGKPPHQHMRDRQFLLPGMTPSDLSKLSRMSERVYFRRSRALLHQIASDPTNGVISVWFSCFEAGTRLGLHVNNDPYMYRAHIGLIVPDGDLGIKVADESRKWREGEALVFDPTIPHTAWNLTDQARVVLIVDFLRPDEDPAEMRELERKQFELMMQHDPLSFGMSGGRYDLDDATVSRFAMPGIG
jgi:hypothetical protein